MLGVELLRRALGIGLLHHLVKPDVAAIAHLALVAGVLDDDDVLERVEVGHHRVDLLLDRRRLALAPRAVDRDQRLGVGELHPLLDRVRREAAEHDVVGSTDPRTREHRHHDLGDHRQVDPDDVALLDPHRLERIGEPLHVAVQIRVGDVALLALLAAPVIRDLVAAAGLDVAVQAVVGGVDRAVGKPLVERGVGVVEILSRLLEPVQFLGLRHPPALPVALGFVVDRRVIEQSLRTEGFGGVELLDLEHLLELALERAAPCLSRCRVCHCKPLLRTNLASHTGQPETPAVSPAPEPAAVIAALCLLVVPQTGERYGSVC